MPPQLRLYPQPRPPNAITWEIDAYRSAGYQGELELVMPGTGALPAFYDQRLAADLAPGPEDSFFTLNVAAVWWKLLDDLGAATLKGTAVDVASVGDNSGSSGCASGDDQVSVDSSAIWRWSDTRWLAYLAAAHGLAVMGETTGQTASSQLPEVMHLAYSCHLTALQWAWDYTLGAPGVTRGELAQAFLRDR